MRSDRTFVRLSDGNRVVAMPSPGMAAADTTNAEPGTLQESVLGDRFIGVVRTGRCVPTPRRTRRRPGLIDRDDAACEPTHRGSFPCFFRVLEASSLSNTSVTCSRRSWWVRSRAEGKTMNIIAPVGSGRPVARRSSSRPRMRRRIRLVNRFNSCSYVAISPNHGRRS